MRFRIHCLALIIPLGFFAEIASADNPKSYQISLRTASRIGSVEFTPGNYKLLVDTHDPNVQFKEGKTGNTIELEAKVETVDQKFEHTAIVFDESDGTKRIVAIRIGGSKTRVAFN